MMGFVLKSAVGLGVVYYAMFSTSPRVADMAPVAAPCAAAARVTLSGGADLRGSLATLNCAAALSAGAQRLAAPAVAPEFAKSEPAKSEPAPAAVAATKPPPMRGSLTEADMEEPWFGPGHTLRKGFRG